MPGNTSSGDYVATDAGMASVLQRLLEQAQQAGGGHLPARAEVVASLPTFTVGAAAGGDTDTPCTVCHGPYDAGEVATRLPCSHLFHKDCLAPWFAQVRTRMGWVACARVWVLTAWRVELDVPRVPVRPEQPTCGAQAVEQLGGVICLFSPQLKYNIIIFF
jgi:E3 ubiquitin-protein ligase RNF115/126